MVRLFFFVNQPLGWVVNSSIKEACIALISHALALGEQIRQRHFCEKPVERGRRVRLSVNLLSLFHLGDFLTARLTNARPGVQLVAPCWLIVSASPQRNLVCCHPLTKAHLIEAPMPIYRSKTNGLADSRKIKKIEHELEQEYKQEMSSYLRKKFKQYLFRAKGV
jgi:hypothetical protein